MKMQKANRGVTLVEIAIVLVIIGLLLGGILKGQELINNAKVRAIADRQNSLKVAWYAFVDRYQSIPGDYTAARQNVPGAGDNTTATQPNAGNGLLIVNESPLVFQHLTGAGYLRCPQCTATAVAPPTVDNSLTNNYGGVMAIFSDGTFYASKGPPAATCVCISIQVRVSRPISFRKLTENWMTELPTQVMLSLIYMTLREPEQAPHRMSPYAQLPRILLKVVVF